MSLPLDASSGRHRKEGNYIITHSANNRYPSSPEATRALHEQGPCAVWEGRDDYDGVTQVGVS